jgi:FkbM family methyltransferase
VDFIPLLLYYTGVFEPGMLGYLRSILRAGDTALDVGANIGVHTLECWRAVGLSGRVISVEASPSHADSVRCNLKANSYPFDFVLNVAVGDHDGEVSLGLPEGGNQGMFGVNAGNGDAFTVTLRRLDDLLEPFALSSLALVKMDIEGSELAALRGASKTIARLRPAMLIELNELALARCEASAREVVEFLADLDYDGWIVGDGHPRPITPEMPHQCDECLFLPREADQLRVRLELSAPGAPNRRAAMRSPR